MGGSRRHSFVFLIQKTFMSGTTLYSISTNRNLKVGSSWEKLNVQKVTHVCFIWTKYVVLSKIWNQNHGTQVVKWAKSTMVFTICGSETRIRIVQFTTNNTVIKILWLSGKEESIWLFSQGKLCSDTQNSTRFSVNMLMPWASSRSSISTIGTQFLTKWIK